MIPTADKQDWHSQIFLECASRPVVLVESKADADSYKSSFHESTRLESIPDYDESGNEIKNKKGYLEGVIEDLNAPNRRRKKRLIGIVDADFNHLPVSTTREKNLIGLFFTDDHDLETHIFKSPAFEKCLDHFFELPDQADPAVSSSKANHPPVLDGKKVRDLCVSIAIEFGYFKLALQNLGLHEEKERIDKITQFLDKTPRILLPKIEKKLEEILDKSTFAKVMDELRKIRGSNCDQYQLTNGHDLVKILAFLTIHRLCCLKKKDINEDYCNLLMREYGKDFSQKIHMVEKGVEDALRACYEKQWFQVTNLWRAIRDYGDMNKITFLN